MKRRNHVRIDFHALQEVNIPNLYNGDGIVSARMFMDFANKVMISRLPVDASIGAHTHLTSSEAFAYLRLCRSSHENIFDI